MADINIFGTLHNVTGEPVANASEIKDGNKTQTEVNAELAQSIQEETQRAAAAESERYTKKETYSKPEVNNMVAPQHDYVTVETYADLANISEHPEGCVYRVSNYDGTNTQVDATKYSEYAWDGTQYIHLATKSQVGEVFDVSEYNATGGTLATYASLSALLSDANLSTIIPSGVRKGGMSVKFVQSSDNKYVQYRYTGTEITGTPNPFLNIANWEKQGEEVEVVDNINAGESSIYKGNIQLAKLLDAGKVLKLQGIGGAGQSNITAVGQYFYSTYSNKIFRCIVLNSPVETSTFEEVPFADGAIYTYANELYQWNGTTLRKVNDEVDAAITDVNNKAEVNKTFIFSEFTPITEVTETKEYVKSTTQSTDIFFDMGGCDGQKYRFALSSGLAYFGEIIGEKYDGTISTIMNYLQYSTDVTLNDNFKHLGVKIYANNNDNTITLSIVDNIDHRIEALGKSIDDISATDNAQQYELNKLSAINEDITSTATVTASRAYNSSLNMINGIYSAYQVDVSKYAGATLKIKEYNVASSYNYYHGFVLSDGTLSGVSKVTNQNYLKQQSYIIPKNAKYFRTCYAPALGAQDIDVTNTGVQVEIEKSNIKIDNINNGIGYNNIAYNQAAIASFLQKYKAKKVDSFNQLNIALAGDSIFGRLHGTELPYTPDMNNSEETQYGYETGHFPPNMWAQNVAYKLLQTLQFPHSDVKYYNHTASEVTKTGIWTDRYPAGADSLRIATASVEGASITLSFTGATHLKWIYSTYSYYGFIGSSVRVSFSDDGGTTWKTPAQLNLTEKMASIDGNGEYTLPNKSYKFGNLIWKGFNKSISYLAKVELLTIVGGSNQNCAVWGFETWSNHRINIIVTAEGGNVANDQKNVPQRFYCDIYSQDLVIYELPYLNDLGTGYFNTTYYKGVATTTLTPTTTVVTNSFYYVNEDGTYNNFAEGLVAYKEDCIQWNGSAWVIGSTYMNQIMSTYQNNNDAVFKRLRQQNVPVLTICPHNSNNVANYPFVPYIGMVLLRAMVKKYGLACIDLNQYQKDTGNPSMWSDGTHLNSTGVKMYVDLITTVVTVANDLKVIAEPVLSPKVLKGISTTDEVTFGFEFSSIPSVYIRNNNTRVVSSVSKSGFVTTGSGDFEWSAVIED